MLYFLRSTNIISHFAAPAWRSVPAERNARFRTAPTATTLRLSRLHVIDNNDVIRLQVPPSKMKWFGPSAVIPVSVPLAFCNLLLCLCFLSHFNIMVLLQFEQLDKFYFILWD